MKKTLITLIGLAALSLAGVQAQVFTGNFTFGTAGNVSSFAYNGTAINNVTVSAFTKNGVTSSSSSNNFRASSWALDAGNATLTGNIDTAKYFQFALTPASGSTLNVTSFTFGVGRSATGPRSFQWRSSLDSFAAPVSGYTAVNAALTQTSGVLTYAADATTSATNNTLTFATPTFQDLSGVTFRFYAFNSEGTGGTAGLEGVFSFAGEAVAAVPEPSTWALIGIGSAFLLWRIRRKNSAV